MKKLSMDEYKPISELVLEQQSVVMPKYPVIDMHAHFGSILLGNNYERVYDTRKTADQLRQIGIRKIVALELAWDEEYDRLQRKIDDSDGLIIAFGSVDISKAKSADFDGVVYRNLKSLKSKGCKGIKLWKNITLYGEKYFGEKLRLDDKRFKPVWQGCAEEKLPIVIHVADPPCFFKPIDENNEHYLCLSMHPEWSWYKPDEFSFEEHMQMQENIIRDNPDTIFVVAHVGSYAENLAQVGKWLDAYPNMYVDVAARLDQLGRQPYTAKAFFEKYQDRIMFGTDYDPTLNTQEFYSSHFRFFQTKDEYFKHPFMDMLGQWRICGIELDDQILKKLYYGNAEKILHI